MAATPEELHAKLQQENAQMRTAGASLQAQYAQLQAENQRLNAAIRASQAAAAAAAGPSSPTLGGGGLAPSGTMAPLKLKAPTLAQFTGTGGMGFQVDTWLRNVKKQFDWYGPAAFNNDAKKIQFATLHMEGAALEWWDSLEDKDDITTWEEFVKRLHQRYRPKLAAEVARQGLAALRQTGTVSQLCNRMLSLLTHVPTMHEEDKIFAFKRALNDSLAAKVAEKEPSTLQEAMHIAVLSEQYLTRGKHGGTFPFLHGRFASGRSTGGSSSTSTSTAMEINNIDWNDENLMELMAQLKAESSTPPATSASAAAAEVPPQGNTQLLAMMQELRVQQHALAAAFLKRSGKPNTQGRSTSGTKVPGVTKEEFERCRKEGLCLKCKVSGHLARDCDKAVQPLKW
jgi:hypothetical protein